jgi:hypothetical protein
MPMRLADITGVAAATVAVAPPRAAELPPLPPLPTSAGAAADPVPVRMASEGGIARLTPDKVRDFCFREVCLGAAVVCAWLCSQGPQLCASRAVAHRG